MDISEQNIIENREQRSPTAGDIKDKENSSDTTLMNKGENNTKEIQLEKCYLTVWRED